MSLKYSTKKVGDHATSSLVILLRVSSEGVPHRTKILVNWSMSANKYDFI